MLNQEFNYLKMGFYNLKSLKHYKRQTFLLQVIINLICLSIFIQYKIINNLIIIFILITSRK